MPRTRPSTSPLSFHGPTRQYYITRARKRIYLGSEPKKALMRAASWPPGHVVPMNQWKHPCADRGAPRAAAMPDNQASLPAGTHR